MKLCLKVSVILSILVFDVVKLMMLPSSTEGKMKSMTRYTLTLILELTTMFQYGVQ
ncbi:hypothetical protein HOLleu_09636 [Holothuria leucospilota]|uniref:Uncharacterized protein n=1 Tax=Holothuria leucospilota TaxID=206669 RepID=A0A9Q1HE97_HOLLE|nr:hypothetical protein HOLleu_09636 [Holothuria leucospilota]